MFTGLISDVGEIVRVSGDARLRRVTIRCGYDPAGIALGASIACSGPCLTVVGLEPEGEGCRFSVDVAAETLARTNAGSWTPGRRINLERSLRLGDELGGHLVTGHVDGLAEILRRETVTDPGDGVGTSVRFILRALPELSRFIAEKGSVCLDGTSLTVNAVASDVFSVLLIPHSLAVTTWGDRREGDGVNLEVDLIARYAARLTESRARLGASD